MEPTVLKWNLRCGSVDVFRAGLKALDPVRSFFYFPHFVDEETDIGEVIWPRSQDL